MSHPIHITASYAFIALTSEQVAVLQKQLTAFGAERGMKGLVLIAEEGVNATVCGSESAIGEWKARLKELAPSITFKDSTADHDVFRKWKVKIKSEIVTIKDPSVRPAGPHRHISPAQWNEMLNDEDVVVIDARNSYEYSIGKFRGAIDPGTRHFSEFPEFVRKAGIPKDKKVMMYCTGGIRCEKALLAMEAEGYENVYQLDGGILNYIEQCPNQAFEGECFVFDERVAVDQHLQPSKTYRLSETGDPCRV